jgi:hypothetical protein
MLSGIWPTNTALGGRLLLFQWVFTLGVKENIMVDMEGDMSYDVK